MIHNSILILYEDADVLVVNKPAGLVVHSDRRTEEPTVVDWILAHRPKIRGVGDVVKSEKLKVKSLELDRPGIVHRLDRETSGALIIAENQTAVMRLKKQFQRGEVHKTYHAFVYGSVKNDEGVIDRPIARSRVNPVLWSATRGRKGEEREAKTEYQVLSRLGGTRKGAPFAAKGAPLKQEFFSFLELYPRTGRTHQIRVHLKAINYPIVSDKLYASRHEPALGFIRLALHSRSVSFVHPVTGKRLTIEAPYPEDFEYALHFLNSSFPKNLSTI